ncbi:putative receptor-like protein kinaseRLK-Pelle-LRR-I-1 family [Arabidopsis thaliana]
MFLITRNLSSSGLSGTIVSDLQNLTHLESLDLSNNTLSGTVPEFLAPMKSLLVMHEPWIKTKKKRFTYSEVMEMTKNLQRPLGEGGFGVVYHGDLNGSEQVAVKLLSQTSAQGYKEFKAEVELLLRVHHINLVSLVGYCDEKDHFALIYEYMSNGDLHQHLSGKHGGSVLNWDTRLQIAIEAALGL